MRSAKTQPVNARRRKTPGSGAVNRVFVDACALPKRQRARLAAKLIASLDPPDLQPGLTDEEWVAEITRRVERAKRSPGIPWETALAELRRRQKLRRR